MIELTQGNLLRADAEALVNTVNCIGFMGKGIALQFKQAFPANFKQYEAVCKDGKLTVGNMLIHDTGALVNPRYIVNFPTKRHWKGNSRIEDIAAGLKALIADVRRLDIKSIAIPPLGCGLGGLQWSEVKPLIEEAFSALPDVRVLLFEPNGAPPAKNMPVNTKRPNMTAGRAAVIKLMDAYATLDYNRSLLEVQKLAYFLQSAGEPLHLKYEAGIYGPYANNLNKVLEAMEGHFTRGYGDSQKPEAEIELLPDALREADDFLADKPASQAHLKQVTQLIEGFETPYGMELLATVHWVGSVGGNHGEAPAADAQSAIKLVHGWNSRKQRIFRTSHILVAWHQLTQQGWLKVHPDSAIPMRQN